MLASLAALAAISGAAAGGGTPSPPDDKPPVDAATPIPDTDPGGHRAQIWGHAFTPSGGSIVSASSDRTLRIWSTETGESRVIRGLRGPGSAGKLFALALSPDGKIAVVGGALGVGSPAQGDIRLIDLVSDQQIGRLSGHTGYVRSLAFSKDGLWLASGDDKGALKIWDMTTRRQVAHFDVPVDHKSKVVARLAFVGPDHIAATANDGLRIFTREPLALEKFVKSAKPATALAVSENGSRVAVAGEEGVVRVLSWPALEPQWEFQASRKVLGLAFGVGPSADRLAVTTGKEPYLVTVWDVPTQSHTATYEGHDNVVQAAAFSPDGTTIASVGGNTNAIHVWSLKAAEEKQEPAKATQVLQGGGRTVWSVGFLQTPDNATAAGTYLAWGYEDPCVGTYSCPDQMGALGFAMRLSDERDPTLGDPFALKDASWLDADGRGSPPVEHRAILKAPSGALRGEKQPDTGENYSRLTIVADGTTGVAVRNAKTGLEHYSFSFDPTGSWIVSGGRNGTLETFSLTGEPLTKLDGHDGDVPAVAVSPDGRLIASGSNDQTVRLWNSKTGELVVSLLHLPGDGRWIMWTPQGYFAAAPASEDLIGWHVDRGPDKVADFVTAGEMRAFFHNRPLVQRAIILASAKEAVEEFRAAGQLKAFSLDDLRHRGLPDLRVIRPNPNASTRTKSGTIDVELALLDNTDDIEKYEVSVNGNQVLNVPASDVTDLVRRRVRFSVPLFAGHNEIVIAPKSRTLDRPQLDWSVTVRLEASIGPLDTRDQAYVLVIGVNGYTTPSPLRYAVNDAVEFAQTMEQLLKNDHPNNRARPIVLVDGGHHPKLDPARFDVREPTRANIKKALEVFANAGNNDTIILFLAGHGTNRTSHAPGFVFLPIDANKDASGFTEASTVPWSVFQAGLDAGKGRKIVFLDACRSSHIFDFGITSDMVASKLAVYSSTRPLQNALESSPHGEFTGALLLGLSGAANRDKSADLEFNELGGFVFERVRERTKFRQTPTYFAPPNMAPFPVVRFCTEGCTPPAPAPATP